MFFSDTSLFDLGALYQLGHDVSDPCPLPSAPVNLTILDISGVHTVRIAYCFCEAAGVNTRLNPGTRRCQLLRNRFFPATFSHPGTAFTFRLLDFLHKLQTQSKVNLYDFYLSLVSVTNSAGQKPPVVCSLFLPACVIDACNPAVSLQRALSRVEDLGLPMTSSTWGWGSHHWGIWCAVTGFVGHRMSHLSPSWKEPRNSTTR